VRVVFATNIFISAFAIPGGNAEEAYLNAIQCKVELFNHPVGGLCYQALRITR